MYACMYACLHVCMYARMRACMRACIHVCMYACMHASMYACMYVCMYACMHVCMVHVFASPMRFDLFSPLVRMLEWQNSLGLCSSQTKSRSKLARPKHNLEAAQTQIGSKAGSETAPPMPLAGSLRRWPSPTDATPIKPGRAPMLPAAFTAPASAA